MRIRITHTAALVLTGRGRRSTGRTGSEFSNESFHDSAQQARPHPDGLGSARDDAHRLTASNK